ncbi:MULTISPECIES: hypothetical protein [unclassified Halomonas]|uniref:hypothetical protein n=1 Tax=unclassified Halomonas TaxID=2609666 RepID=UPI0020766A15|nr:MULTISPECIES: hypothetical protein [unclassified Halomonas]
MAIVSKSAPQLTTVLFLKPYGRYAKGDRAGFPADKVAQMKERKIAVPVQEAAAAAKAEANKTPAAKPVKGTEGADKV